MGAEYRGGEYYGSSTTINDNVISEKSTWSSNKIAGQIDDISITGNKTWSSWEINSRINEKADSSVIAPVESDVIASRAYAIGEHFIKDGKFCTAKTAIAQNEAFTLNTNYTAGDIAGNLQELKTDFLKTYILIATSSGSKSSDDIFLTPPQFSGYKLVGILGYHELSSINVYFYNLYITSTGMLDVGWKTRDGSTVNDHQVGIVLLYVKNQ